MLQHVFFSGKKFQTAWRLSGTIAQSVTVFAHMSLETLTQTTQTTHTHPTHLEEVEIDRTLRFRLTAVNSRHPICHRISKLRVRFVNPFFSPSNSCIHIPFVKATDAQWSLWSPQKVTRFDSLKFTQETELSEIMKP